MTARPLDARPAEATALAATVVGERMDIRRRILSGCDLGGPIVEVEPWDNDWIIRYGRRDGGSVCYGGRACPWGIVGDRLYVRERWSTWQGWEGLFVHHAAGQEWPGRPWRPSRSMPRQAARTWLRIVGVRPEQDVLEDRWVWILTVEREKEGT